jgi:very-short-patch-repair endonuclease
MRKEFWDNITEIDVKKAIAFFEKTKEKYPEPRNTFLIYKNKKYPAKHIRGLAYFIAYHKEISKNEFSGGKETVSFFENLGFNVQYNKAITQQTKKITEKKISKTVKQIKSNTKKLNVVSQKNALQRLFQKHFGHIETEKKFDWLKTPDHNNLPEEYKEIVSSLSKYRNHYGFQKSNYHLLCDIVLDEQRLIIEYDENQHFTKARKITLENYHKNVQLNYSKTEWIEACDKINSKDNNPIDRDEKRAYYDSVRDIEAFKNGYLLLRIKHGDIDWEAEGAEKYLDNFIPNLKRKSQIASHKIARLIITKKQCNLNGKENQLKIHTLLEKFIAKFYNKKHFEFILTPGGFLNFEFPLNLHYKIEIEKAEKSLIPLFESEAEKVINQFFESFKNEQLQKLKTIADFFTIGIDGTNPTNFQTIELIALYNLKNNRVVNWTGKFYPTEAQKNELIKINDLSTHFVKLNNQNVAILGCHDLNVYSPRGQANANPNGWKKKLADNFKKECKNFNPSIILQHPHTTDTPNIWNLAWRTVEKELPNVKHFASGIKYYNHFGVRDKIEKVLEKTKKGDVTDFYFE